MTRRNMVHNCAHRGRAASSQYKRARASYSCVNGIMMSSAQWARLRLIISYKFYDSFANNFCISFAYCTSCRVIESRSIAVSPFLCSKPASNALDAGYCDPCSRSVVCLFYVCLSVTRLRPAQTAERIDVLFRVDTPGGPRNTVLDGVPIPLRQEEGKWGILPIFKCRHIDAPLVLLYPPPPQLICITFGYSTVAKSPLLSSLNFVPGN